MLKCGEGLVLGFFGLDTGALSAAVVQWVMLACFLA
jgi:hypothetical protein